LSPNVSLLVSQEPQTNQGLSLDGDKRDKRDKKIPALYCEINNGMRTSADKRKPLNSNSPPEPKEPRECGCPYFWTDGQRKFECYTNPFSVFFLFKVGNRWENPIVGGK